MDTPGLSPDWNPIVARFGVAAGQEWQTFLNRFILGTGFALLSLSVPEPAVAALCRNELDRFLRARGEHLKIVSISEPNDLRSLVLQLLAFPTEDGIGALWIEAVVGLDAPGYPEWHAAWFVALTELNQHRNPIRRHFSYPLVLVGAPWVSTTMRDEAPDLWSIRSLAIQLEPDFSAGAIEQRKLELLPDDPLPRTPIDARLFDPDAALRAIERARSAPGREANLVALLSRAGRGFAATGQWVQAEALTQEAIELAHRIGDLRAEAVALVRLGDIATTVGRVDAALAAFKASQVIFERLAASDPGHAGWQRDLSVSHIKIGDVLCTRNEHSDARQHFQTARDIVAQLVEAHPRPEWQRDLAYIDQALASVS